MLKSEFLLQLVIFGMTAAVVMLLVAKIYPSALFYGQKEVDPTLASKLTQSIPKNYTPPSLISIPQINLNLPIAAGTIVDNEWTLYEDKVSWLTTSQTPGNGNVILFAHNKDHLFGPLRKVQVGQEIIVGQGDRRLSYVISQKRQVTPKDVDAVLSDRDQLTLYTCDGSFDQKRLIVIATPKPKTRV